ncbi:Fkbp59 [Symbiodinium sp. CCMP2456]|nr:Fkbp59 [Symbiodinium sp. CCMP2456]
MQAALAAKGYDLLDTDGGAGGGGDGEEEDSDEEDIFGRIRKLPPDAAREKGKKAFQDGDYDKAIRYWQGGLKSILGSLCAGPAALSDQSLSELDLTLNLNIAMAYMKKEDYHAAERSVDKALARREALPAHLITKALYRKAMAQRSMRRLDQCLETLGDLLEVEAGHAAAKQMQQEVEREWAKQCRDQKKNMRKLFDKLSGEDRAAEEIERQQRTALRDRSGVRWTADDVDSEAFAAGSTPPSDGKDWGLALSRTVLWAMEQLALEGPRPYAAFCTRLPGVPAARKDLAQGSGNFTQQSSTCELRWLKPAEILKRLPAIQCLALELIGFLGEIDPDNSRVPDPNIDKLPEGIMKINVDERQAFLRATQGSLEEALDKELLLPPDADGKEALPQVCFIAHPQLHRYFSEFHPAISWLITKQVPTIIIGASDPDPSWQQDEQLLRKLGAELVVSKRESPYPMCLPGNSKVKKCSHIIGFRGGKAIERDKLMNVKLELLAQEYSVR